MDRSDLIVIIPAYNEEASIKNVVEKVNKYSDVLVVNDASSDNTEDHARKAGANVINHNTNLGYDEALNTGFEWALKNQKMFAITFDGDGQHEPKLINVFKDEFAKGKEIILGVRPQKARLAEHLIGYYFLCRFGIHDILCGMKGYHLKWAIDNKGFDHTGSVGSELCFHALKNKASFVEVPIPLNDRLDEPRFGNRLSSNLKIIKALLNIVFLDLTYTLKK